MCYNYKQLWWYSLNTTIWSQSLTHANKNDNTEYLLLFQVSLCQLSAAWLFLWGSHIPEPLFPSLSWRGINVNKVVHLGLCNVIMTTLDWSKQYDMCCIPGFFEVFLKLCFFFLKFCTMIFSQGQFLCQIIYVIFTHLKVWNAITKWEATLVTVMLHSRVLQSKGCSTAL